jgi:hypothetical protein
VKARNVGIGKNKRGKSMRMKEVFQLLEEASKEVGLVVNEGKTKYKVEANTQNCSKSATLK